jgi:ParB-like chromosome segregation protein Spo0J
VNKAEYKQSIIDVATELTDKLRTLHINDQVDVLNKVRLVLSETSPFKDEPIDCVQWVINDRVQANDYNPNAVAPPEMELLEHSILSDGYTQPIVTWPHEDHIEVIDGFHRNRVGKESAKVKMRLHGYLPVVFIKQDRENRNDRIASTIRHNRARGKHKIDSMSDIVIELKKRNWSDNRICKELGMDPDEVLRLCQVSGLVEVFADNDFSEAWDAEIFNEDDFSILEEGDV